MGPAPHLCYIPSTEASQRQREGNKHVAGGGIRELPYSATYHCPRTPMWTETAYKIVSEIKRVFKNVDSSQTSRIQASALEYSEGMCSGVLLILCFSFFP